MCIFQNWRVNGKSSSAYFTVDINPETKPNLVGDAQTLDKILDCKFGICFEEDKILDYWKNDLELEKWFVPAFEGLSIKK